MKVAVISNDKMKTSAIARAFEEYFSEKCEVKAISYLSNGKKQPYGEEIFTIALTRVCDGNEVIKYESGYDYIVSAESGVIEFSHILFNCQAVCIWNINRRMFAFGISSGIPIQKKYLFDEEENLSLTEVLDKLLGGEEMVNCLTKGFFSREKMIRDATIMALTHYNWD